VVAVGVVVGDGGWISAVYKRGGRFESEQSDVGCARGG
jgi:hypothetical protein